MRDLVASANLKSCTSSVCIMQMHSCLQGHVPQYLVNLCLPVSYILGSISGPPIDDSWSFRVTGCKCTANGLSLLMAGRSGTHCLTAWEIWVSPEIDSADFWKHNCSLCTEASSPLEVLRKHAIQIYYLLTYFKRKHGRKTSQLISSYTTGNHYRHFTIGNPQIIRHS